MQINEKGGERLGRGEEKGRPRRSVILCFELPFQQNRNSDWSPICQSVNNKKKTQSQRSPIFKVAFCST